MPPATTRRTILRAAALAPLAMLPACASVPGFSLTEAVRRLLDLSSQRAFARLLAPGGFWDDQVTRIDLPALGGPTGLVADLLLRSPAMRERIGRTLASAAARGAERAAPFVADTIRTMSIADAAAIVRQPGAGTAALASALGGRLVDVMAPDVGQALRIVSDPAVGDLIARATGADVSRLARDVGAGAVRVILSAIGEAERDIRANPAATRDPLIGAVFGIGARL